jgi:hypothetical protein
MHGFTNSESSFLGKNAPTRSELETVMSCLVPNESIESTKRLKAMGTVEVGTSCMFCDMSSNLLK